MEETKVHRSGEARMGDGSIAAIAQGPDFSNPPNWPQSLPEALYRAAQTSQKILHIPAVGDSVTQSYRDLWNDAVQVGAGLTAQGCKSGHFVILQFPRSDDFLTALWGCLLAGCVPVPIAATLLQEQTGPLLTAIALLETSTLLTSHDYQSALSDALATSTPPESPSPQPKVASGSTTPSQIPSILTLEMLHPGRTSTSATNLAEPPPHCFSQGKSPDALALLLLTSGSTSAPKGVMLSQQNLRVSAFGMAQSNQLSAQDITLNWMPLEHVASLVMFHFTEVYLGCDQIHVANEQILKHPLTWLDLIERHRVTATWAPNFAYGLVNEQLENHLQAAADYAPPSAAPPSWDLSTLHWMGNGAEAVVGKTTRRFLQLLAPHGLASTAVSPGYGMSETCSGIVHSHSFSLASTRDDDAFVNVGEPIPGLSVRIVDDANQPLAEGLVGRLQVQGLTVMMGYYARPDLNGEAFTADGWFKTGDLGLIQAGRLTITGREKDVIILNGVNYYSHDVEALVEELDTVERSYTAACGVRHPEDGTEQLAVFVHPRLEARAELKARLGLETEEVQRDDLPLDAAQGDRPVSPALEATIALTRQVRSLLLQRLGIAPAYVIPVAQAAIPKTNLGKIQRSQLVQQFEAGRFKPQLRWLAQGFAAQRSQHASPPQTELEQEIAQIWQTVLKVDAVGSQDNFFELGGTSLRLMQVLSQLQATIAPTLTAVQLFQYPSVGALAEYLGQLKPSEVGHPGEEALVALRASLERRSRRTSANSARSTGLAAPMDIAVIGMAGRFPGARNLEEFWHNLTHGVESISPFSDEELLSSGLDPVLLQHPNYVKVSPILDDVEGFDANFFGYSPKEAELMDPQQRLLLECAWESLESAGYDPLSYDGEIGLYAGATMNTYLLNHIYPQRDRLDPNDHLDVFTLSSLGGFQATIANDKDYLTTRVSYKLNLRGPSINVQTACSTSLVAIHLAAQSILQGECTMALAGGVSVETPQKAGYLYQDGMILSPDGHCRAFDAKAQGTLFGSGVGLVVLKRLEDAIADGDCIQAVIKGSALGNDGGQKVGYLAPRSEGQAIVAAQALAIADISPESLGYVEAHGTGTALGDPIEIAGLSQAFRLSTQAQQFCPIGSVKTNLGHLNIASGIVGFIKTVLSLKHGQVPPSLHFEQPNPQIDFAHSPFYVNATLADWPQSNEAQRSSLRRAAVNSLGIGGTNVHVILEQGPQPSSPANSARNAASSGFAVQPDQQSNRPVNPDSLSAPETVEVLTLSAKSPGALRALVQRYGEFLAQHPKESLSNICFTANAGRSHFAYRAAWVTPHSKDLQAQLKTWLNETQDASTAILPHSPQPAPITFLFTGQGSQSVNMGRSLYEHQPVFRAAIQSCSEILSNFDIPLLALLYPETAATDSANPQHTAMEAALPRLTQTAYTQPVLFALEYALWQLWQSWGITPTVVLGHSLGEYVAACVAGVFSLEDALLLVATRGRLMQALPPGGAMLSVSAGATEVEAVLASLYENAAMASKALSIAALNGPQNTVVSGDEAAIAQLITQLTQQNILHKRLQVSHAFHSPHMEPMLSDFRQVANAVAYQAPQLKFVSNLTGSDDADWTTPDYWVSHISHPVRFAQSLKTLQSQGYQTFLECGPRPVLLRLAQTVLSPLPGEASTSPANVQNAQSGGAQSWLPSLSPRHSDGQQMLSSLAQLYCQGHRIDWAAFYSHRRLHRLPLPTYPFQHQRYWLDRPIPATITPAQSPQPSAPALVKPLLSSAQSSHHPLLGPAIPTPLKQRIFQQSLSPATAPFLQGHQLNHQVIFPGAAFFDLALSAGALVLPAQAVELRSVTLVRSLRLDTTSQSLQTILSPEETGYRFQIYSQAEADWILHCEGTVVGVEKQTHPAPEHLAALEINQLQQKLSAHQSGAAHYQHCDRLGLQYSGDFRAVQTIWRGKGQALGQIQLPQHSSSGQEQYHCYPALLDACFQIILAALPQAPGWSTEQQTYIPIGVDRLHCYGSLVSTAEASLWSYVTLHPSDSATHPAVVTADVKILDAQGQLLLLASGLSARRIEQNQFSPTNRLSSPTIDPATDWHRWLYQIDWQPTPSTGPTTHPFSSSGHWLVVADCPRRLKAIAAQLSDQGQTYVQVLVSESGSEISDDPEVTWLDVQQPDCFVPIFKQQLLNQDHDLGKTPTKLMGVIYGFFNDETRIHTDSARPTEFEPLWQQLDHGIRAALHLVQALVGHVSAHPANPARLWLVTQGAQPVQDGKNSESPSRAIATAPLWAMGRTIALEHPEFNCAYVDLDPHCGIEEAIAPLLQELQQSSNNSPDLWTSTQPATAQSGLTQQIAHRSGQRYAAKLVRQELPNSPAARSAKDLTPELIQASQSSALTTNQTLQIPIRGSLEQLQWFEVDRRPPLAGEVEIRVLATGLNFRDVLNALGLYPGDPGALGLECVGEVVAVGSGVKPVQVGTIVMALSAGLHGAGAPACFSQFVTLPSALVIPKPTQLSPEAAATIPVTFLTSYYALCKLGQMGPGDRVLIHAAAGGVGQAAVQLAQQVGAEVFATASPPKWEQLKQQGVRHVFNSRQLDFAKAIQTQTQAQGVTLVLNSLTGEMIPKSLEILAPGGRFLEIGKTGIWSQSQMEQVRPDVSYEVIDLMAIAASNPQLIQSMLSDLTAQFHTGALQPLAQRSFSATEAIAAFRWMQQGKHIGKVVITPPVLPTLQQPQAKTDATSNPSGPIHPTQPIQSEATYLVTGGLGALGLQVSQWLVEQGARHLLLLGRNAPHLAAQQLIDQLHQSGITVTVLQADVAHPESLKTALQPWLITAPRSAPNANPPLKGIFHLAGQLDDGVLPQQTWERFASVLEAKVKGAWLLHSLSQDLPLDHFVLFSSAASLLGSAGQCNYAVANGFLDSLAHWRHQAGLSGLSLNWGAWAGGGLAQNDVVNQRLARTGMPSLEPEKGLALLTQLIQQSAPQMAVLPGHQWSQVPDPFLAQLVQELPSQSDDITQPSAVPPPGFVEQLLSLSKRDALDQAQAMLLKHLQQQLATVLGVQASTLDDVHCGFNDQGLDSLTTIELRNRLQTSLERPLSATLLYDYPTLSTLTQYLLKQLRPEHQVDLKPSEEIDSAPQSSSNAETSNTPVNDLAEAEAEALLLEELNRLEY